MIRYFSFYFDIVGSDVLDGGITGCCCFLTHIHPCTRSRSALTKRVCADECNGPIQRGDRTHSTQGCLAYEPHEPIVFLLLQCECSFAIYRLGHLNMNRFETIFLYRPTILLVTILHYMTNRAILHQVLQMLNIV